MRPASATDHPAAVAIIPARFQSTRLPGKPLVDLCGVPMICRVLDRVRATPGLDAAIVATDDERVREAVLRHGGMAVMTSPAHRSGTDRLAEVAATLTCDLVVNVQGDEPLIEPAMIREALAPFADDAALEMSTLVRPFAELEEFENPNVVKAVVGRDGHALYFSRAPVPYHRPSGNRLLSSRAFKHIGLYVYRRTTLLRLAGLAQTALEEIELLEQLRALEHGIRIRAVETSHDSIGVDTEADVVRVRALLNASAPDSRPVLDALANHHAQP